MNTIFFKSRLTSSWENFNCCRFRSSRFAVLAVLFFFFPYFWFHEDIAYNEKEDCFIHTINKPSFSQSQRSFDLVSLSLLPFHTYPKQTVFCWVTQVFWYSIHITGAVLKNLTPVTCLGSKAPFFVPEPERGVCLSALFPENCKIVGEHIKTCAEIDDRCSRLGCF